MSSTSSTTTSAHRTDRRSTKKTRWSRQPADSTGPDTAGTGKSAASLCTPAERSPLPGRGKQPGRTSSATAGARADRCRVILENLRVRTRFRRRPCTLKYGHLTASEHSRQLVARMKGKPINCRPARKSRPAQRISSRCLRPESLMGRNLLINRSRTAHTPAQPGCKYPLAAGR